MNENIVSPKICPLKLSIPNSNSRICTTNCAWYVEHSGKCAVLELAEKTPVPAKN